MLFCERLENERKKKGVSQRAAAKGIGITNAQLSNYEHGVNEPTVGVLTRISEYYGVSLDYLCGLSDDPYPSQRTELDHQADALAAKLRELPADFLAAALVQVNALAEVAKNREVNAGVGYSLKRMTDGEDLGDNRENRVD